VTGAEPDVEDREPRLGYTVQLTTVFVVPVTTGFSCCACPADSEIVLGQTRRPTVPLGGVVPAPFSIATTLAPK